MNKKLAFIAIGGNSLIKSKELQTVEDQHTAIQETVRHVADLIEQKYQVLISHGNGPQVGFIMRRSEVARRVTGLHLVPLVNVVADTQGSIGYQIQQSLNNELAGRNIAGQCVTVVTQVVVDRDDPGFKEPAKPVGEFFDTDPMLGHRLMHQVAKMLGDRLEASQLAWVSGTAPPEGSTMTAKIRYRQQDQEVQIEQIDNGRIKLVFRQPQRAVTPGQSVVLYDGDVCLGGGIIENMNTPPMSIEAR